MIQSTCGLCNTPYQIDDSALGMQINCPSCGKPIVVEIKPEAPPAPAPPAAGAPGTGNPGVVWAGQGERRENFKVGYKSVLAWVYAGVAALVGTLLVHGILIAVSMKFKTLPHWLILYLPIVPGLAASLSIFSNEGAKNNPDRIPGWIFGLAAALAVALSAGPNFLMESIHAGKVRKTIVTRLSEEIGAPNFAYGKPVSLLSVKLGKPQDMGSCKVEAFYSDNLVYQLNAVRNVSKLEKLTGIPEMKAKIVMANHNKPLTSYLQTFEALRNAKVANLTVSKRTNIGYHPATVKLADGISVKMIIKTAQQKLQFKLTDESAREIATIPIVTKLWKEFDASGKKVCTKVSVGEKKDEKHWDATALLSDGKEMPIIIQEQDSDDGKKLHVFFPPKETAIMMINRTIQTEGTFDGRTISELCINLKPTSKPREDEELMKVIFVEETPADVLVRADGYNIQVMGGMWKILSSDRSSRPKIGWSLMIPEEYNITRDNNDQNLIKAATKSGKAVMMNTKEFSDVSRFSLSEYVEKERDTWTAKAPSANAGDITSFKTVSGIKGLTYSATAGGAFRAKYFFKKGNDFAIIQYDDNQSDGESDKLANTIAESLRYKDVAKEK